MTIKGIIEEVIYRNEENGYTVLVVETQEQEFVTAVGKFPQVNKGELVELGGNFSSHSKYGEQFNVTNVKISSPNTREGIVRYLSSGLIKGVGPVTALSIVEKFGKDTLDIIEFNPEKLTEVRGISTRKATEIAQSFYEIKKMQNAVLFLQQYNITTNMAVKIYNTYGNKTETVLNTNPYRLIEDVDGVGFFTADKIAQSMGILPESEFRYRAGILHILKENSDKSGNTYIVKQSMTDELEKLLALKIVMETMDSVLTTLSLDGVIKETIYNDVEIVALSKMYNIERIVADTVNQFNIYNDEMYVDIEQEISNFEMQNKFKMHEHQRQAVSLSVNSGISVITGGPGTGKTTIIKCILQILNNQNKKVKLLAPTGRAAKKLSESTGSDASTIHRALEVDFTNTNMFYYNQTNKLPYDVIIVDEVSMVDVQLFYYLLRAIKRGAKLILVGDKDQLPSVGAGNVLADILQSEVVSVAYLTHIYRQSNDSLIITNAHLINAGKLPVFDNKSTDFFFYENDNAESILQNVIEMQSTRIPKFINTDSSKIQVLSPMKAGICGVDNLNKQLQEKNNPHAFNKYEIEVGKTTYRVGDRVMQVTNNYERVWEKEFENGSGVFNGDIGIVLNIDSSMLELSVLFEDGRVAKYNRSDINELVLSYAITIHKSQGSEFDVVIIPIASGPPMLLTKNLFYTAVTRAKKMVVLVGNISTMRRMVKNNFTTQRFTLLKDMLINSYNDYKKMVQ